VLFSALPTSIQSIALTNPAAAASDISSDFATGIPTWFSALPDDVQSYYLTEAAAVVSTGGIPIIPLLPQPSVTTPTKRFTVASVLAPTTTAAPSPSSTDQGSDTVRSVKSQGLSSGAKTGIGVGIGFAGLCLIGLAIWFFLRRTRNGQTKESTVPEETAGDFSKPELDGIAKVSSAYHEMPSSTQTHELPGSVQTHELPD
jgi:hypothetical protein